MIKGEKIIKQYISELLDEKASLVKANNMNFFVLKDRIYRMDLKSDILKFSSSNSLSPVIQQMIENAQFAEDCETTKLVKDSDPKASLLYEYSSKNYIIKVMANFFLPYLSGNTYKFKIYNNYLYILDDKGNIDIMVNGLLFEK